MGSAVPFHPGELDARRRRDHEELLEQIAIQNDLNPLEHHVDTTADEGPLLASHDLQNPLEAPIHKQCQESVPPPSPSIHPSAHLLVGLEVSPHHRLAHAHEVLETIQTPHGLPWHDPQTHLHGDQACQDALAVTLLRARRELQGEE